MKNKILNDLCDAINNFDESAENSVEDYYKLRDAMFNFLDAIIKKGNFKDSFEFSYSIGLVFETIAISKKTGAYFRFGFNTMTNEISFISWIHNSYNLKNIQDSFWIEFFTTCDKYNFKYVQNCFSPKAEKELPDLYKTFKGNIYRLMRNYFVSIAFDHDDKTNLDMGSFEAVWNSDKDITVIYDEACIAMKLFYKLNYNLWKINDLKKY